MKDPLVTVLMPAYNAGPYIDDSISAILNQTFPDFEFMIVNDGSVDDTESRIQAFTDKRIVYLQNERNSGIVKTLNKGLALAKGKYVLRTDADDIAVTTMIADLVDFMEKSPDYIICGGNMQLINGDRVFVYPSGNNELKIHTLNACPFSHSTVMFRLDVLKKNNLKYVQSVQDGEDHALWSELLPYGKFHNLKKVTLFYRESPTQVTAQKSYADNYDETRIKIFARHADNYFSLKADEVERYLDLVVVRKIDSISTLGKVGALMQKILVNNETTMLFDQGLLKQFLFIKWYALCHNSYYLGRGVFFIYIKHIQGHKLLSKIKSVGNQFIKMLQA